MQNTHRQNVILRLICLFNTYVCTYKNSKDQFIIHVLHRVPACVHRIFLLQFNKHEFS